MLLVDNRELEYVRKDQQTATLVQAPGILRNDMQIHPVFLPFEELRHQLHARHDRHDEKTICYQLSNKVPD